MGTCYYVACRDCKVVRDLDKFYLMQAVENRAEALALAERIASTAHSFRAALLVSFMAEHFGHHCTAFSEHDEKLFMECLREGSEYREEREQFWSGP